MTLDTTPPLSLSLARQISENIQNAILHGRLAADERLPTEEALAERFGVSRPTIREALKRLAAMNLIHSRRGPTGGTFVTTPSLTHSRHVVANAASLLVSMNEFNPFDIIEARRSLESACVHLAIERRTEADLNHLETEVIQQKNTSLSDELFCQSDVRFHQGLVQAAHNPVLLFQAATVIDSLQPVLNLAIYKVRDRQAVVNQHHDLLNALTTRKLPEALAALHDYLDRLLSQLNEVKAQQFTHATSLTDQSLVKTI